MNNKHWLKNVHTGLTIIYSHIIPVLDVVFHSSLTTYLVDQEEAEGSRPAVVIAEGKAGQTQRSFSVKPIGWMEESLTHSTIHAAQHGWTNLPLWLLYFDSWSLPTVKIIEKNLHLLGCRHKLAENCPPSPSIFQSRDVSWKQVIGSPTELILNGSSGIN